MKLSRTFSTSSSSFFGTLSLQYLLKRGFSPTLNSINNFLLYLSRTHRFDFIVHFFSQLDSNKIPVNSRTHSIVSQAFLDLHKYEEAESFMNTHMSKSSISSKIRLLDSLVQGFCIERDDPEKALAVLRDCLRNNGAFPSSFTFCSLIHRFIARGNMDRAIEVLEMLTNEKVKYPFDNFVCSAVISGFCRIGEPELALGFFENALSSGASRPNLVTYTAVVSALCKLGRVREVSDLVSRIEKEGLAFDVVFYSNWICGYFREGALMDAFLEHRKMVERGINPDIVSYTILIDGFSKEGNIEKAVGFLGKMIKEGLKPNLVTYTSIMRGFCKKGKLEEAFALFKKVLDMGIAVDEFTYATLIDGSCRKGDMDRVFHMLGEMEQTGIKPSIVTYNTVINGLCKIGRVSEADEVSKGVLGDIITYTTLLHGYTAEENIKGVLETKHRFKEAGIHMDLVMCNVLLKALFIVGAFEDADCLYKAMPEMDLVADSVTYSIMIEGYCKVGRIEEALEVFDEFRKQSISSVACYRTIVDALCKKGMLDTATEVFLELCEKGLAFDIDIYNNLMDATFAVGSAEGVLNMVYGLESLSSETYNKICNNAICFLCKRGSSEAASEVYMVMRREGLAVARKSYYSMLKCLLVDEKYSLTRALLNVYIKEYGLIEPMVGKMLLHLLCLKDVKKGLTFLKRMRGKKPAVTFSSMVLKKLVEDGRALDAYELVVGAEDNLPSMDVVDYSIMVDGLCKEGYPIKALDLCAFAKQKEIALNIITYNSVINGVCLQGCFIEAFRIFDSLERIGLVPSEVTYTILIDNLCKEGFLQDAKKLFDRMVLKGLKANIYVYNSMIDGYCKFGQMGKALKLLSDLEIKGITPDGFTVSSLIYGYCLNGDMEEAFNVFVGFKRKQISPDILGYLYLMKGFCTKGRMEEARSILRKMLQSDSVLELISKVDTELESESIRSFLVDLCEQGSIPQAVTILEEVASILFPIQKQFSLRRGSAIPNDKASIFCSVNEEQLPVEDYDGIGKRFCFSDFGRFYSVISSLCSKGELRQANRLIKTMLSGLNG